MPNNTSREIRSDAAEHQPALVVAGLSYAYGPRKVLHDVTFSIFPGEFVVLLGLNGAGKTTLFSLVTRLYAHRSGRIEIFGAPIDREPASALSRMGVVFQQPTLDLDLTVEQNLRYHAALHGLSSSATRARMDAELGRVELDDRRTRKVRELSGGQRRRVEIARALMHDPKLLLLDEPTVGLDVAGRQFLLEHVRRLCRESGIAVLWATHLIDEVDERTRVLILDRGRILADGSPAALTAATETGSVRAAFDAFLARAEGSS